MAGMYCVGHSLVNLSSCMALSAGQSPREMYSRSTPSNNGVFESC